MEAKPHLNCKFRPYSPDGVCHVHPLVYRDNVWFAGGHPFQEAPAAADVKDDVEVWVRLPNTVDDLLDVGTGKYVEILGLQLRRPGVEDLDSLCSSICLRKDESHSGYSF